MFKQWQKENKDERFLLHFVKSPADVLLIMESLPSFNTTYLKRQLTN